MTIETRDFGTIDISESGILKFKLPILGFEEYRDFVILYDDNMGDSISWLQSVDERDICFIIIDPTHLSESYRPVIPDDALTALNLSAKEAALRCLMVVPKDISAATVNLKSPLVINPAERLAAQVVLEGDYPVRAAISSFEGV